ncbi:carbamoyltransferase family protein [Pseudoalteromonas rhizosphaerae]|uniref:carbamoyltransferase family protein n=1 Tax=Pseudoalteromonas rhizosphaerae TaxID=2518973 RepID=UPI002148AD22|nr:carbamoyltransferase C-terminal domain-containing protein [Pseudoalteromonas rhizosphaerae]
MSLYNIGLSTTGHDPAVAIANAEGKIIFAEATERFLQDKRAWGAVPDQLNHLKPILQKIIEEDAAAEFQIATTWSQSKGELPIEYSDCFIQRSVIEWMKSLHQQQQEFAGNNLKYISAQRTRQNIFRFDHHLCHATNATYSAPFNEAACLVLDGEGEVGAAALYHWKDGELKRIWRSWGPGSVGAFYAWLTELCGFSSTAGEEWKVMGLAAYGEVNSTWYDRLTSVLKIENGRILWADGEKLNDIIQYFESNVSFRGKPYSESAELAATAQAAYAYYVKKILQDIYLQVGSDNLILCGGCALNSAFNGTILSETSFKAVHVPSAPADDGNAIGAAILSWKKTESENGRQTSLPFNQSSPYLGSTPEKINIKKLADYAFPYAVINCESDGVKEVASLLAEGKIIGVMRGAAEFGPRALGNRSILADPRSPDMKNRINAIVKGREAYRPFAPVISAEKTPEWFENAQPSPYMSFTLKWKTEKLSLVPAVVHQDHTGRLQTLTEHTTPWLKALVDAFEELTHVPILLNTSFNVMGKPIVHTINDALAVLSTTGLDAVLIDNVLIKGQR